MGKKVKIVVERFDQGITTRWYDTNAASADSKNLAVNGNEHIIIGEEVWSDVSEVMNREAVDEVVINIEYETMFSNKID